MDTDIKVNGVIGTKGGVTFGRAHLESPSHACPIFLDSMPPFSSDSSAQMFPVANCPMPSMSGPPVQMNPLSDSRKSVSSLTDIYNSPYSGAAIYPAPSMNANGRLRPESQKCQKLSLSEEGCKVYGTEARLRRLLEAITEVNQVYLLEQKPQPVFNALLSILLDVTGSNYGFIGSVYRDRGQVYLKTQAVTDISWTPELKAWYQRESPRGMVFSNKNSLFGEVLVTQRQVISNDPKNDPRAGGLPMGHPPLLAFLGMPLITGGEFCGLFGIANRAGGYDESLVEEIAPLTITVAQMVYAFEQRQRRVEAELHLSSVIEAANEGIITFTDKGQITSMNTAACQIFGYSMKGFGIATYEDVASTQIHLKSLVIELDGQKDYFSGGGNSLIGRMRPALGRRVDGAFIPLELTISFAKGTGRIDQFMVAVIRNISERVEAEARLKASEERWLYALSGSDDGVWDWWVPTDEVFFSDRWTEMLGYEHHEVAPNFQAWVRLLHPDDQQATLNDLRSHLESNAGQYVNEQRLLCKDGSYRWFLHRGKLLSSTESGQALRFVGTHTDITQRKEDEAVMVAAKESAERASRAKAEFLANMSHEIRTPMNGVIGMTSILLETDLTMEQRDHLLTIQDSGSVLLEIIKDILDYSKIESGKLELESTTFNFIQAVERVVELTILAAESKGLELALQAEEGMPCAVIADAGRTLQVLLNIISNAVKFTDEGHVAVHLSCEDAESACAPEHHSDQQPGSLSEASLVERPASSRGRHMLVCRVEDTGIGIPADKQNRIFQQFTQVDASFTRRFGGTGLGLAISKQLVELMGGTISFESLEGTGTSFTVRLPGSHEAMAESSLMQPEVPELVKQARVLLVGSSEVTENAISMQLGSWGIHHQVILGTPEKVIPRLLLRLSAASASRLPAKGLAHKVQGQPSEGIWQQDAQGATEAARGAIAGSRAGLARDLESLSSILRREAVLGGAFPVETDGVCANSEGPPPSSPEGRVAALGAVSCTPLSQSGAKWPCRPSLPTNDAPLLSDPSQPRAFPGPRAEAAVGLAKKFDLVMLDCFKTADQDGVAPCQGHLAQVLEQLSREKVPLVLLVGRSQMGDRVQQELCQCLGPSAIKPVILRKPMVRAAPLLEALLSALDPARASTRSLASSTKVLARKESSIGSSVKLKGTVLLAEDNFVNQKVACSMLASIGVKVDVVPNGMEAVAAVQRTAYHLLLMDCQMPIMDGFSASREIRKLEKAGQLAAGSVPIVALTANALKGDREKCLEAGMNDYLTKPVSKAALLAALRRYLPP